MDGLLVDTESIYRDTMIATASALGYDMTVEFFLTRIGLPAPQNDLGMLEHFGDDFPLDTFNAEVRVGVEQACAAGVSLKPGVVELLDLLDELGLPRAIATSSSHRSVELHLGASGIIPRFDAVLGRGDYVHGKPAPDPYLTAAAALGVAPTACLALEDSHNGVRSAAAAGTMTVMIPDMLDATDEMRGLCVDVLPDLHAVRALLPA